MKICNVIFCAMMLAAFAAQAATRVEMRTSPLVATGVEYVGSADGSSATAWDTTREADGWKRLSSGGMTADVLVLNETAAVVGGRLAQSETWDDGLPVVVRDDVVVPTGATLTLGAGAVVKFTPGAGIAVEAGGAIVAEGAYLAAFDDDSVGGDTDMNGETEAGGESGWWRSDAAVAALATVRFVDGATNLPTRTYTAGKAYGALPVLERDDAIFSGWFAGEGGNGAQASEDAGVVAGETTLYAAWTPYELTIFPTSQTLGSGETVNIFAVEANMAWTAVCDADWVEVNDTQKEAVRFAVAANLSQDARTATIRVTTENGQTRDFTLTQQGMERLAAPSIAPTDGTTFTGSSRRVSISGAASGAEIRYTLDGSEPTENSKLYTKSFNVFDTTVVTAKAFLAGMLPSESVSSRIVRLQTLSEALDVPLWEITNDADNPWQVVEDVSHDGKSAVRSGAIGIEEQTAISSTVEGAGTLAFWWRVDCEDDPDYDDWDYLAFFVDGAEIARIDGDSGWRQATVKIKSDTTHTLKWVYSKDYMDDDLPGVEDCGWIDQISWTPFVGEGEVPIAWIENLGVVASGTSAVDAAAMDPDGDGLTTAQEYVAGTDPSDGDSAFIASIEIVDGSPVVSYTPDLLAERKYTKYGRKDLSDPDEQWVEIEDDAELSDYNFFKVTVDMP